MATPTDYTTLCSLLNKAEQSAPEFQGGYSRQFLSAEKFNQTLG